jgi:acetyl-CoA synthase
MGQRDTIWIRISKEAQKKGFKLHHLGSIIHAKLHNDYSAILDKVQVTIYTKEENVLKLREDAKKVFHQRDDRISAMTDESVDIYYSCTLCQSFAPNHLCIITPERSGLCGAYNWLDGKAANQIDPTGPNQPVNKGEVIDPVKGQWKGVNEFIFSGSRQNLEKFNAYSIMEDPMTSCGCFECISGVLPIANAVMTVNREFSGMTPVGMKFSTLAGSVGGGLQTPGFVGHSKHYIGSKKFISSEGGLLRLAWMPKMLKEEIKDILERRGKELGIDLLKIIADEDTATTEEEIMAFMQKVSHPALNLPPLM